MKNILNSNSLLVLLLTIGTCCIVETLKNRLNNKYRLHQLTRNYSTMNLGCNVIVSHVYVCSNQIDGSSYILSDFDPLGPKCNYVDYHVNVVNLSNTSDTCQFYHYSGNLTATVTDNYGYNSNVITSDSVTPNDIPSGVYNYTMNADINLCRADFYVNLTLCNDGSCVVYDPIGIGAILETNDTCVHFGCTLMIHSINKTSTYTYR